MRHSVPGKRFALQRQALCWIQLAIAVILHGLAAEASGGQSESSLDVPSVTTAPRLEDFLSDAPGVTALRIDHFVQRQPGDGVRESEQTTAYLSHDRQALYIVFVCHDREPENIRANLTKREATLLTPSF